MGEVTEEKQTETTETGESLDAGGIFESLSNGDVKAALAGIRDWAKGKVGSIARAFTGADLEAEDAIAHSEAHRPVRMASVLGNDGRAHKIPPGETDPEWAKTLKSWPLHGGWNDEGTLVASRDRNVIGFDEEGRPIKSVRD